MDTLGHRSIVASSLPHRDAVHGAGGSPLADRSGRKLQRHMKNDRFTQSRAETLALFRQKIARGEAIIGGGAGTGISAKSEEAGGIDLIVIYNSGRYRMAGRGSLAGLMPYGNANQIVKEMAYEVIPVVLKTPVLAGVCATDPFLMPRMFLRELQELGFAGIQNFPTVGLIDGEFRANLEETGMGFQHEIDVIALAREMDLLTTPYVFDTDQARAMTGRWRRHPGRPHGLHERRLDRRAHGQDPRLVRREIKAIVEAAKSVRDDVIVLCHGGPLAEPDDARYVIDRTPGVDGFYGASSTERLPTEVAIRKQIERFKTIRLPR